LSFKFVKAARSQTPSAQAPSSGELPPEFLSETTGGTDPAAPAAPSGTASPNTAATPAPAPSATPSPAPGGNGAENSAPNGSASGATGTGDSAATVSPATDPGGEPAANAGNEPESVTAPAIPRMGGEDYTYDPTGRRD